MNTFCFLLRKSDVVFFDFPYLVKERKYWRQSTYNAIIVLLSINPIADIFFVLAVKVHMYVRMYLCSYLCTANISQSTWKMFQWRSILAAQKTFLYCFSKIYFVGAYGKSTVQFVQKLCNFMFHNLLLSLYSLFCMFIPYFIWAIWSKKCC